MNERLINLDVLIIVIIIYIGNQIDSIGLIGKSVCG